MKQIILIFSLFLFPPFLFAEITNYTLETQVTSSKDDAEERIDGNMYTTSSDLELIFDRDVQTVGMRFTNILLPANATVSKAYIQFQVDEASTESVSLTIHGEKRENTVAFTTTQYDITSRPKTVTSASWSPVAWTTKGVATEDQRSSDLSLIIEEIISQAGWSSGNAMVFMISGSSGKRVAESYNGDQAGAPLLHIEYSIDASTTAPVITLLGANPMNLNVGDTFIDPGATAFDNADGNLTSNIQTTSTVNMSLAGNYEVTYSVSDTQGNSDSVIRTVTVINEVVNILQRRVISSKDDAEERASGNMYTTSSDLELIFDRDVQTVGMRFTNILLPANATVSKAYIQFQVDEASTESVSLTIHGEKRENTVAFTTTQYDITSRPKTVTSASWSPVAWTTKGAATEDQRSSDLSLIIEEIISQAGWSSGNAMVFMISGSSGKRVAESYNGDQAGAPLLHIEYSVDASNTAPVITLLGANPMNLNVGDTFIDPGATAFDNEDGNLTGDIQVTSTVNTSLVGNYEVTYRVSDVDGNSATVVRSVVVSDTTSINIINVPSDYASVHEAFANAEDGDTILLAPGTYDMNETLYITKDNITIASRYLITKDENDITSTILNGNPNWHLIDGVLDQSANLKIIGLTMNNSEKAITFTDSYGEVHHCRFNNTFRDTVSFDTNAGGAVTYSRIENSGDDAIDIDTRRNGSFLIAYNELINSNDDGIEIHLFNSTSEKHMYYDIHDNLISIANEDGIQLIDYDGNTNRSFDIYRNIFQDIRDVAIGSMFEETAENFQGTAMAERVRIYNNYFYKGNYHITGGDNMIVLNNVFEEATGQAIHRVKGSSIVDHNLFYNNTVNTSDTLTGSNNLFTNPQRNSDFTLPQSSPAIDTGTEYYIHLSEVVLQLSNSEYIGLHPDMGWYEYGLDYSVPVITLLGPNPLNINAGDIFIDPGAVVQDEIDGDLTNAIQSSSNINMAIADTYTVTYEVVDSDGNNATAMRSVVVSGTAPINPNAPVITILGDNPMNLYTGDAFVDPGAMALDDVDGNLSALIENTSNVNTALVGSYQVIYTVTDSDGNSVAAIRSVTVSIFVDTIAPVITLLGTNPIYLNVGDTYVDQGATALDDIDGNLTTAIVISSNVNTAIVGNYQVTYSVSDLTRNSTTLMRDVLVSVSVVATIYEDAEDGSIGRWIIYDNDPIGATIENVYNADIDSRVIHFTADGTRNSFQSETWLDTENSVIEWKMQASSTFRVTVQVHTNNGTRYFVYTNYSDPDGVLSGKYIWYGIGSSAIDGTWHTYARDLRLDLQRFEPDNDLIDIGWFRVNGSGSFDDIQTYNEDTVPPVITILGDNPLNLNVGDTFIDPGTSVQDNQDPNPTIQTTSNVNTNIIGIFTVNYTAIDASGNSDTVFRRVTVTDPDSTEITYEDAEDENTIGWRIHDNTPTGAVINNVYDADWGSRIIEFNGNGTDNSYRLSHALVDGSFDTWNDRIHTTLAWSIKYSEPYEIDIKAITLHGTRHLIYENRNNSNDGSVSGEEISYGLGDNTTDNVWHSFVRDIRLDIINAEADNELISIEHFTINGSGSIDDIVASGYHGYTVLNRIGYIKRSIEDEDRLGDLEAIRYIESDNAFAIVDDVDHLMYTLSLETQEVTRIYHDYEFAAYTQENPNGYEPLNTTCQYDATIGAIVGFCDPESIAYDGLSDTMYIFTGNHPGELTAFKLERTAPDQNFTISDWQRIDEEHSASIMIDGQLYVTGALSIKKAIWDSEIVYGETVFTTGHEIQDMAYDNGNLWIITSPAMLYKIDFLTMTILDSYNMLAYDIKDPRGVEIVNGKLYIADGDDYRTDDLLHAIHIFDLP